MPQPPPTSHLDDAEWVRCVLAEHERSLILYCAKFVGVDRARDIVQDAFLRLISSGRDSVEDHVVEWLYTVCRNRCFDVIKKERRMTGLSDERERMMGAERGASEQETAERRRRIVELLNTLPERQQEVIRLKFLAGLSYKGDQPRD